MKAEHCCLIAFDIDNCLMPVNESAREEVRQSLLRLQESGAHLTLASGKPCVYLSGLSRGLGIIRCSLIGENGAEIWINSTMPPTRLTNEITAEEALAFVSLKAEAQSRYGDDVFLQPNTVGVTVFPAKPCLTPDDIARDMRTPLPESITRYVHVDSVDWAVSRFNKGASLLRLAGKLCIPKDRIAAVGDGKNDLPMLNVAAHAFWVGDPETVAGTAIKPRAGIDEVLAELQALVEAWRQE